MQQIDLTAVRKEVFRHRGSKVRISANKGRHKVDVTEGIIKEVYPYIFMIEVQDDAELVPKTVSFSYSDVMTRDIQMILCG